MKYEVHAIFSTHLFMGFFVLSHLPALLTANNMNVDALLAITPISSCLVVTRLLPFQSMVYLALSDSKTERLQLIEQLAGQMLHRATQWRNIAQLRDDREMK